VACTKETYDYIRAHPNSVQNTSGNSNAGPIDIDSNDGPGGAESQQSDAESESDEDKFKLILRSALTANKEINLVVRPTTKCGAIVKAFLKKAGLSGQYPEVFAGVSGAKKGGRKSNVAAAGKDPRLCLDGDKLDNASEIGDADLEDGDMIEVVGL
jgi:Ubiquitin-2 like Rad60 SUMO-like